LCISLVNYWDKMCVSQLKTRYHIKTLTSFSQFLDHREETVCFAKIRILMCLQKWNLLCTVTRTKYYCVVLYLYRKIAAGWETHSLYHTVHFEKNGYHMRGEAGEREAERMQKLELILRVSFIVTQFSDLSQ